MINFPLVEFFIFGSTSFWLPSPPPLDREMLGPLYAGLLAEYISFAAATTVTALLPATLVSTASLALIQLWKEALTTYIFWGGLFASLLLLVLCPHILQSPVSI